MSTPAPPAATRAAFEIHVASKKLVRDDRGRLVEDPGLLRIVERLKSRVAQTFGRRAQLAATCAEPGRYVITVTFDPRQREIGGMLPERALHAIFSRCARVLDAHVETKTLKTAAQLELQDKEVRLSNVAATVVAKGGSLTIHSPGADVATVPAPGLNAFRAIKAPPVPDKAVDGRVTGVGEDEGGTRIEINRAAMYFVPKLAFDEAAAHVRSKARVNAMATSKDGAWHLKSPVFRSQGELPFTPIAE